MSRVFLTRREEGRDGEGEDVYKSLSYLLTSKACLGWASIETSKPEKYGRLFTFHKRFYQL